MMSSPVSCVDILGHKTNSSLFVATCDKHGLVNGLHKAHTDFIELSASFKTLTIKIMLIVHDNLHLVKAYVPSETVSQLYIVLYTGKPNIHSSFSSVMVSTTVPLRKTSGSVAAKCCL